MRDRTADPLLAKQVLSQLSYTPISYLEKNNEYSVALLTLDVKQIFSNLLALHRKEVIQPHLLIRLPCYDFTPVIAPTLDGYILAVYPPASGVNDFRGVTGGVYKARERIHRCMLTSDY